MDIECIRICKGIMKINHISIIINLWKMRNDLIIFSLSFLYSPTGICSLYKWTIMRSPSLNDLNRLCSLATNLYFVVDFQFHLDIFMNIGYFIYHMINSDVHSLKFRQRIQNPMCAMDVIYWHSWKKICHWISSVYYCKKTLFESLL